MKHEPNGREEREIAREGTREPVNKTAREGTREPVNKEEQSQQQASNTRRNAWKYNTWRWTEHSASSQEATTSGTTTTRSLTKTSRTWLSTQTRREIVSVRGREFPSWVDWAGEHRKPRSEKTRRRGRRIDNKGIELSRWWSIDSNQEHMIQCGTMWLMTKQNSDECRIKSKWNERRWSWNKTCQYRWRWRSELHARVFEQDHWWSWGPMHEEMSF